MLFEAESLKNDFVSYLVRSLLSEGKINYETVEKTKDGLKAVLIEREGPTGFITTTTRASLHPDNETRMLSLTIKDTPEQTKAVMSVIASDRRPAEDLEQWKAFQTLLSLKPNRVSIPFGQTLAKLIPPVSVRLRRDFSALLGLIRGHALMHYRNRDRNSEGEIVAEIEDYGQCLISWRILSQRELRQL